MVKPETVDSILSNLRGFQDKLNILAQSDFEEFAQDFTKVESAKHFLYDILYNHLSDFDIFVQHILDYLFT